MPGDRLRHQGRKGLRADHEVSVPEGAVPNAVREDQRRHTVLRHQRQARHQLRSLQKQAVQSERRHSHRERVHLGEDDIDPGEAVRGQAGESPEEERTEKTLVSAAQADPQHPKGAPYTTKDIRSSSR